MNKGLFKETYYQQNIKSFRSKKLSRAEIIEQALSVIFSNLEHLNLKWSMMRKYSHSQITIDQIRLFTIPILKNIRPLNFEFRNNVLNIQ